MTNTKPIHVKCTGGAAAQVLALMDAVYLSNKTNRPFVFDYFPFGTGTYWPFEIQEMLKTEEIGNLNKLSRGHKIGMDLTSPGKIVVNHPINSKLITLDKVYSLLRKVGIDKFLLALRNEVSISFNYKQLHKVNFATKSVSGGFIPLLEKEVLQNLNERFVEAGVPSPFSPLNESHQKYDLIIHYRVGDKRAKFTNPRVVGDDGILDPQVVRALVEELDLIDSRILLISDEPEVATKLLSEVGLITELPLKRGGIWSDLQLISGANCFIGTWSQVSQLASVCVLQNGGVAFLPKSEKGKNSLRWSIPGLKYYRPVFLEKGHPIYFT